MPTNKTGKIMLMIFSALVIFLFTMCDDFKDETLKPDNTDAYAIEVLSDTGIVDLASAVVILDTTINKYTARVDGVKDTLSSSYSSVMDMLVQKNIKIEPGDNHYGVTVTKTRENALLLTLTDSKEINVYTTSYVDVEIYDENKVIMDNDLTLPSELAAGLFEYNPDKSGDYPKPIVKSKNTFELSAGNYVLNILTTEATVKTAFSLVVVEKQ